MLQRIKDIEAEIARTQKNKATEGHLMGLKARLAKLRTQLLEPASKSSSKGEGFEVSKVGDARVALIGFPSVGKSTLLQMLTGTESIAAAYEFTTLTCIPGNIMYKGTKIQLLDLPGIIEGAAHGKGRGRQVVACAKSADMVMMVLDAGKEAGNKHREILERELEIVGIRLNKRPPNIAYVKKDTGGVKFNATVPLTKLGADPAKTVYRILHEYKIHNADVLFRGDYNGDELIDVIEGNRRYMPCLYVYNKVDTVYIEDVDRLARLPTSTVISCHMKLGLDNLLVETWDMLGLVRVYTKKRGHPPDFEDPVVLTGGRYGITVEGACMQIHRTLVDEFHYALVWGSSTKHNPQRCGLSHVLQDEDVLQVVKKTVAQQRADKNYGQKVQAYYDKYKEKKRKKKPLKS